MAIGVTADSFVVYFERIRDEIRDGHSLHHSIQSGWHKARGTILMADGVQLLAAVVLYFLAIGSVKGFAFTLGVTTAIDLLLVIFFTHPLMTLLGRTTFFGEGHKNSGLDPQHLGVSRASLLGRRGTARKRTKPDASAARKPGTSKKAEEASHE
ncbi:Protein translocase subunit SecD [bioreactor metagenome]|uniref:Protein translocase subunit SecD n=1 Tax=bioreactor metagenome TaxID=1076179 RepID=A0A645BM35_9ZZZZ